MADPIDALLAGASVERGLKLTACAACHFLMAANKIGPVWVFITRLRDMRLALLIQMPYGDEVENGRPKFEPITDQKYAPGTKMNYAMRKPEESRHGKISSNFALDYKFDSICTF